MTDRERVFKWLEKEIRSNDYWDEDYTDCVPVSMLKDILALLKAQEPRVLTLEEAMGGDECWFEYIDGPCGYVDVYMQDNKTAIIYRTNRRPVQVLITDYMKKWRCWSCRPTVEQRKEVKWDDSD